MAHYEDVVLNYLRADRSIFVNTQCCIQLNRADNPDGSGPHWYCDAVAVDFRRSRIFLCEVSYSAQLSDLIGRLRDWHANWEMLRTALVRDCSVPQDWPVRPWVFIPETSVSTFVRKVGEIDGHTHSFGTPLVTPLDMVQPWQYCGWNRVGEATKPQVIPEQMQT